MMDGNGMVSIGVRMGQLVVMCMSVMVGTTRVWADSQPGSVKTIVLIAGGPSHGFGSHEHRAGCLLLAKLLNDNVSEVHAIVSAGWPADEAVLNAAASIVIFCDGGSGHLALKHMDTLRSLMAKGVGFVCLHYAVEVPKDRAGQSFLDWVGGYFEANWSVNPHWLGRFEEFPNHPIARGVRPFAIRDEWYYHMRFRENMQGVVPILSALPPADTLKRKDGPHSNNPAVRAAVLERKEPQNVGWACERPDGGRGFGFTGGHFHWNWAQDDFRKVVLNGIVWTAHVEVPAGGVPSPTPTLDDLLANQDFQPKKGFDRASVQQLLDSWK